MSGRTKESTRKKVRAKPTKKSTTKVKDEPKVVEMAEEVPEIQEDESQASMEDIDHDTVGYLVPKTDHDAFQSMNSQTNSNNEQTAMDEEDDHKFDHLLDQQQPNESNDMKIYVCKDHDSAGGPSPVSIVIAHTFKEARLCLDIELSQKGLKPYSKKPYQFTSLSLKQKAAYCLSGSFMKKGEIFSSTSMSTFGSTDSLKLFICKSHWSLAPNQGISIVIAENTGEATGLLINELNTRLQCEYDFEKYPFTFEDMFDVDEILALNISTGEPGGSEYLMASS